MRLRKCQEDKEVELWNKEETKINKQTIPVKEIKELNMSIVKPKILSMLPASLFFQLGLLQ